MTIADRPDFARGRPPALAALFGTCLKIGMLSFGGGLTGWLHREFVGRHCWIPDDDFNSTLALAQIMPGANVVNLSCAWASSCAARLALPSACSAFCCRPSHRCSLSPPSSTSSAMRLS